MPGDALWALAACLLIEAFFAPVARIVCMCRYRVIIQRAEESLGSPVGEGVDNSGRGGRPVPADSKRDLTASAP